MREKVTHRDSKLVMLGNSEVMLRLDETFITLVEKIMLSL